MTRLRILVCAVVGLAGTTPAASLAAPPSDEVIATAQGAPPPPPAAATSTTVATTPSPLEDASREGPLPDRKVHGAVSVGVGTNGYREIAGSVDGPIGKDGEVFIAIDVRRENAPRSR